jgi:XTP/dITP diphosphohydrolase
MIEIVLATNNPNKVKEISRLIKNPEVKVLSLKDIGFTGKIVEDGETLAENALIKARAVKSMAKGRVIMADDTGLEVDYLGKAPGVYSARFAGPECSYIDNNRKLLKLLKGVSAKERSAVFRTVVALIFPDGSEETHEGRVFGSISVSEKGNKGFGYDPVFYLKEKKKTYAQMELDEKNRVSHRMKAVKKALRSIKIKFHL